MRQWGRFSLLPPPKMKDETFPTPSASTFKTLMLFLLPLAVLLLAVVCYRTLAEEPRSPLAKNLQGTSLRLNVDKVFSINNPCHPLVSEADYRGKPMKTLMRKPNSQWKRTGIIVTKSQFDGCDLRNAQFDYYRFCDCSFVGANLSGAVFQKNALREQDKFRWAYESMGNNLEDAVIHTPDDGTGKKPPLTEIGYADITKTKSFKDKNLRGVQASYLSHPRMNLRGFNLEYCTIGGHCDLTDADIRYAEFLRIHWRELSNSRSFSERDLTGCTFYSCNFQGAKFRGINFNFCTFTIDSGMDDEWGIPTMLKGADFTGAIITNCDFTGTAGLTIEQIRSTKSYQNGGVNGVLMKGIKLPPEIQKALDKEKKGSGSSQ